MSPVFDRPFTAGSALVDGPDPHSSMPFRPRSADKRRPYEGVTGLQPGPAGVALKGRCREGGG